MNKNPLTPTNTVSLLNRQGDDFHTAQLAPARIPAIPPKAAPMRAVLIAPAFPDVTSDGEPAQARPEDGTKGRPVYCPDGDPTQCPPQRGHAPLLLLLVYHPAAHHRHYRSSLP